MTATRPINDFMSHIDAMRSLVGFLALLPMTVPHVMTVLTEEQRRAIYEPCVTKWIDFNRELYGDPSLYVDPPNPTPVNQDCPPIQLSDEIRERIGKNHPFFDFIHAPFTGPLGTQISLIAINYCWDAYDTFVKRAISWILERWPDHPNCRAYLEQRSQAKADRSLLSTDAQLAALQIGITDEDLQEFLRVAEPSWSPTKARELLSIAKALRSVFTHHFGKPDDNLRSLIGQHNYEAIRIVYDKLEVLLPLVSEVSTVVQGHALIIERNKSRVYDADAETQKNGS